MLCTSWFKHWHLHSLRKIMNSFILYNKLLDLLYTVYLIWVNCEENVKCWAKKLHWNRDGFFSLYEVISLKAKTKSKFQANRLYLFYFYLKTFWEMKRNAKQLYIKVHILLLTFFLLKWHRLLYCTAKYIIQRWHYIKQLFIWRWVFLLLCVVLTLIALNFVMQLMVQYYI